MAAEPIGSPSRLTASSASGFTAVLLRLVAEPGLVAIVARGSIAGRAWDVMGLADPALFDEPAG